MPSRRVGTATSRFRSIRGSSVRCSATATSAAAASDSRRPPTEMLERMRERLAGDARHSRRAVVPTIGLRSATVRTQGVAGVRPNPLMARSRLWVCEGVPSPEKFIPGRYLSRNRRARLDLLRGLLDTDGWVERWGTRAFLDLERASRREDVIELVRSLGGWCSMTRKRTSFSYRGERRAGREAFVLTITHPEPRSLFLLSRKAAARAGAAATSQRKPVFASDRTDRVARPSSAYRCRIRRGSTSPTTMS